MTNNANLKRAARSFMEKHEGVTYLTALKAVDEPLHELRDLTARSVSEWNYGGAHSFRVIPRKGSYGSPYGDSPTLGDPSRIGLSEISSPLEFYRELVWRTDALRATATRSIWTYREHYRAGLLGSDARPMEPLLHHYAQEHYDSYAPLTSPEAMLGGIYGANISPFLDIYEAEAFIPATPKQLVALFEGGPTEEFDAPFQVTEYENYELRKWTDSYSLLAVSKAVGPYDSIRLTIFFRRNLEELHAELRARDLDPLSFDFRDISGNEIHFEGKATTIHAQLYGQRLAFGRTENVLLWN